MGLLEGQTGFGLRSAPPNAGKPARNADSPPGSTRLDSARAHPPRPALALPDRLARRSARPCASAAPADAARAADGRTGPRCAACPTDVGRIRTRARGGTGAAAGPEPRKPARWPALRVTRVGAGRSASRSRSQQQPPAATSAASASAATCCTTGRTTWRSAGSPSGGAGHSATSSSAPIRATDTLGSPEATQAACTRAANVRPPRQFPAYRVTCADTARQVPSRFAQMSV